MRVLEVDATTFERLADVALAAGEPTACIDAAAAYTGDLLPDAVYEEWTIPRRERLRLRQTELLRCGALGPDWWSSNARTRRPIES